MCDGFYLELSVSGKLGADVGWDGMHYNEVADARMVDLGLWE